jgi:hypothetical protein
MTINITGAIKAVSLYKCKNVVVNTTRVVVHVEVMHSSNIKIYGGNQLPLCNLEMSDEVKIFLTNACRNCQVITCSTRTVNLKFPKEGRDDKSQEDCDFVTKIFPDSFETRVVGDSIK